MAKFGSRVLQGGRNYLTQVRTTILAALANKVQRQIVDASHGRLNPAIKVDPRAGKFTVYVFRTPDDPKGQKARQIERETGAFKSAVDNLKSKSYVMNVINREL
jgi:hypothetical protein